MNVPPSCTRSLLSEVLEPEFTLVPALPLLSLCGVCSRRSCSSGPWSEPGPPGSLWHADHPVLPSRTRGSNRERDDRGDRRLHRYHLWALCDLHGSCAGAQRNVQNHGRTARVITNPIQPFFFPDQYQRYPHLLGFPILMMLRFVPDRHYTL